MYDVIKCGDDYLKTSGILWYYYWDEPALNANGVVIDFPANSNNSTSFRFKTKIVGRTENDSIKDVKTIVPLKYFIKFWRTLVISENPCPYQNLS